MKGKEGALKGTIISVKPSLMTFPGDHHRLHQLPPSASLVLPLYLKLAPSPLLTLFFVALAINKIITYYLRGNMFVHCSVEPLDLTTAALSS